jgi:hypothetical protein
MGIRVLSVWADPVGDTAAPTAAVFAAEEESVPLLPTNQPRPKAIKATTIVVRIAVPPPLVFSIAMSFILLKRFVEELPTLGSPHTMHQPNRTGCRSMLWGAIKTFMSITLLDLFVQNPRKGPFWHRERLKTRCFLS